MRKILISTLVFVGAFSGRAYAADPIRIDGSSTVYPITEAVAEEYQAQVNSAAHVTVGISGTGGGFKKFVRGELDISDASRPILATEIAEAKKNGVEFIELPIAFDALTVVVNPQNTWVDQLTLAELKKMWEPGAQQKINSWKQIRDSFPDAPLKLFGAGSDSGTFDYFTEAVVGTAKSSRGDYTASEDDNVLVQGVAHDKGALGYFGYAYYVENKDKLKAVPIVNPKTGKAVLPSEVTAHDGTYAPLARPIFIYVNVKSLEREEVRQFAEFYLKNAAALATEVKYVPLPAAAYTQTLERLTKRLSGTAFAGTAPVGLKIDEILNRPLKK